MILDIDRARQEVIVRQFNDEMNTVAVPATPVGAASATATLIEAEDKFLTVEEVLRRVEELARLH